MNPAYLTLAILACTLILFIWGRWRYDIVALMALMVAALLGVVHFNDVYAGLSNPAVITVVCVMIITRTIAYSGIVDQLVEAIIPATKSLFVQLLLLTSLAGLLSAFMNNVAALALLMPVAIETSQHHKRSPSLVLMPLAFASVLGGLITMIGTPPNLLIAAFRQKILGQSFGMFDFAHVGLPVACVGIAFLIILGWRLVPVRRKAKTSKDDLYQIGDYLTEINIPAASSIVGETVEALEKLAPGDFLVVGLIRSGRRKLVVHPTERLAADDILIVEVSHEDLHKLMQSKHVDLMVGQQLTVDALKSSKTELLEAVVQPGSRVELRSAQSLRLRSRSGMNLLGLSRKGSVLHKRIHQVPLKAGDVLLLQGDQETLFDTVVRLGLLPLVHRAVNQHLSRRALLPLGIFFIAIVCAALHVVPTQVAFTVAALLMVVFELLPLRYLYDSIDWQVILLLAAFIPLGGALQHTGGTQLISEWFLKVAGQLSPVWIVGLLMFLTMTLSDLMNNAATTVIMAPIALALSKAYHVQLDPFLMSVAIGASCSFLTPVAHQNNTLVMGPGGYKFMDYWRLGLPLELLVLATAWPLVLWAWPL